MILPIIGLDYPSYFHYSRLTQDIHVNRFADGEIDCNKSVPEDPSAEDTAFVINYAVNSIIQIESFIGNLDKPFDTVNPLN